MRIFVFAVTAALVLTGLNQSSNAQITAGMVDDFSVVGDAGWQEGGASPNPPTHNSSLGLDGLAGHLQNVADFRVDNITAVSAVPEPSATMLLLVGLSGLVMRRTRS